MLIKDSASLWLNLAVFNFPISCCASPTRHRLSAWLISLWLTVAISAHATESLNLSPISVTSHYDNAIGSSDAASEGSVTSTLIANRPTLRTGEILEFVPGMIVSQHSGDGKANQYYLRGFNLDHGTDFATYVDEMPVNMRSHAHGQGYTDLNFLIPELVERIHYRKGPYYAEEGDFSSAGAAHLQLANSLPQGVASISIGENAYQRYLLANSMAAGQGQLLYGLEINRTDGPWDNPENLRKLNGVLRYSEGDTANGFNVTAMAYHNHWDSTDQIPSRAVSSGLIGRYGAIDTTDGGTSSRYSLSYGLHRRNADGAFEVNAYAVQSSLDLYSNFSYFLNDPVNGDQFNQREQRRMAGLNVSQSWFSTWAGVDVQNKLGMQTRYDRLSPVGLYNTVARQRLSTVREDRVNEASIGLYAENTAQWLPKFRSVAGLRYDTYAFDVDSSIQGNSGNVQDDIVSPKLSLIFGPWANTEYFVNVGKGFHSNDARGTTQTQLPNGGGATSAVTPLVNTRGMELGLRTEVIRGLQSSLAVWRLDNASELVFVGDAGETEASRASKRVGVEWNNHYIANDWLLLDMDLAATHARFTEHDAAGDYIPGAINQVASLGATVTRRGNWSGAFQLRYFGPRPLIEDNSVRSDATTIAYLRVGYKIDAKTRLTLDIFNLFNRKNSDIDYYYASRLQGEALAGVDDVHFHPVEPRTARVTLTYIF
jgi:outer membrane receptor protein involved in Fe transport